MRRIPLDDTEIPERLAIRLYSITEHVGKSREEIVEEAVRQYLDELEQQQGLIQNWRPRLEYIDEDPDLEANQEAIREAQKQEVS